MVSKSALPPDMDEAALEAALEQDQHNIPVLIALAEIRESEGDDRRAFIFYRLALNLAAQDQPAQNEFHEKLDHARQFLATRSEKFENHLRGLTDEANFSTPKNAERFVYALDLLTGKSRLPNIDAANLIQKPKMFFFPGLEQRPFFEREEFDWIGEVEAAIPQMQEELAGILADEKEFPPYVVGSPGFIQPDNPLLRDPSWGALYLWEFGKRADIVADRCPKTMAVLEKVPIPKIKNRSPMALYSLLKPQTHIQPHCGLLNTRLICHIPLIVPSGCALTVGKETRKWEPGKALIFDDSIEHEAWNRGASNRIILLFEIWHPEITAEECDALTAMYEAIDQYTGTPPQNG